MRKSDCIFGKAIDLLVGTVLMAMGILSLASAFTIFPIFGFILAIPLLWLSVTFLAAPRDPACFMP